MLKILFLLPITVTLIACGDGNSPSNGSSTAKSLKFETHAQAQAESPTGLVCERTEVVPQSRGRGNGAKSETITYYYPGFLRGDVNSDGLVDRSDAMLAVKELFKVDDVKCPATADIGGYPQTLVPDGFFTAQDVYLFNQFKHSGVITWPQEIICAYNCAVPNHMDPSFN